MVIHESMDISQGKQEEIQPRYIAVKLKSTKDKEMLK